MVKVSGQWKRTAWGQGYFFLFVVEEGVFLEVGVVAVVVADEGAVGDAVLVFVKGMEVVIGGREADAVVVAEVGEVRVGWV